MRGRRTGSRHFSEWSFDKSHTLEINNRYKYSLIYITSTVHLRRHNDNNFELNRQRALCFFMIVLFSYNIIHHRTNSGTEDTTP